MPASPATLLLVAEGELQLLDVVVAVVLQGDRVADRDRANRRLPLQRHAGGDPVIAEAEVARARVHVAVVDEGRDARALADAAEQLREVELEGAGGLDRAAERLH